MKTIPIPRLIIYVILAGLILPIFVAISYFSQRAEMFQLQQAIEEIHTILLDNRSKFSHAE